MMPTYSNLLFCSELGLNEAGTGLFGSLQNFATRDWVPMTQLEDGGHPPQIPDEMGAFAFSTQGCIVLTTSSVCFFELQPVYVIWMYEQLVVFAHVKYPSPIFMPSSSFQPQECYARSCHPSRLVGHPFL